jgi:ribosomal protein S18 acetylase RimI-like enzyme
MVLRGPKENYKPGSHWVVGDNQGYAELRLMDDLKPYLKNTLYIEDIVIKAPLRKQGYGRKLYEKVEKFALNLGVEYIQLDSEEKVIGFWQKMGFKELDEIYYQNKIAMIKRLNTAS